MRAAEGGKHENGGRHISGAERIVSQGRIEETAKAMLERAFSHTRGQADFINIVVEKVEESTIKYVPLLKVESENASSVDEGRQAAKQALARAGVTVTAAEQGILSLTSLADSMRGAMLLCSCSGERLDTAGTRGIRVSRMDIENEEIFTRRLTSGGICNDHVREALVLASKVVAAPGIIAELCWSDDPEYTTGYVASAQGYIRIPHCKPLGNSIGGRIFFVNFSADLAVIEDYLQHQSVLVIV